MSEQTKVSFVRGAAILAAAAFISRFLGLFYRVVLNYSIGTEGVGVYQIAYPFYTFLLVFSVSGLPVALAKLVSEKLTVGKTGDAYRIFRVARKLSTIVGAVFAVVLMGSANWLTQLLHFDERSRYSIMAVSPAIFVVSIMAVYRGFFQGMQNMKPTAYSQVFEQIVRMISIVALSQLFLPFGLEWAAAGATFSAVTGAIVGLIVMLLYFRRQQALFTEWKHSAVSDESTRYIIRRIFNYAIPVVIAASIVQLMSLVSVALVPQRLELIGFGTNEATSLYGEFTGVVLTLVQLPQIITLSLQTSLIPSISSAFTLGLIDTIRERAHLGVRLAILTNVPAAAGLFVLAEPLCHLIGGVVTANAAVSLRVLALGVIFIALQQISSGILQGVGLMKLSARNMFLGVLVNAVFTYILTGIPWIGIQGAAIATMLGYVTVACFNLLSAKRKVHVTFPWFKLLLGPVVSSLVMMVLTHFTYIGSLALLPAGRIGQMLAVIVAVVVGAMVYFSGMILIGGLTREDLQQIPGGRRLIPLLRKIGLLKETQWKRG